MRISLLVSILILSACKTTYAPMSSEAKFEILQGRVYGLISHLEEPRLRICFQHRQAPIGHEARASWAEATKRAALAWIEPLREISPTPLATAVDIMESEGEPCDNAHATVIFDNTLTITANAGAHVIPSTTHPTMEYNPTRTLEIVGTADRLYYYLLHEFGHMYGLADTYHRDPTTNLTACKPDQPDSVMCSAGYPTLTADDIAGIRAVFLDAHPEFVEAVPNDRITGGRYRPVTTDLCQEWFVRPEMEGPQLVALTVDYCGDRHRYDCYLSDACTYGEWRIEAIRQTSFVFVMGGARYPLELQ